MPLAVASPDVEPTAADSRHVRRPPPRAPLRRFERAPAPLAARACSQGSTVTAPRHRGRGPRQALRLIRRRRRRLLRRQARSECFGVLGPNGAGKSTTIKMICLRVARHRRHRSASPAWTFGTHAREIKRRLGLVPAGRQPRRGPARPQEPRGLRALLRLSAPASRGRASTRRSSSSSSARRPTRRSTTSPGGMKRRLVIARSLVHEPAILVLDEPTTGLDPQARHLVWQKLRLLQSRGVTMLLTTHYMDEAAHLCDRLVIMHRGKVLCEGNPHDLIAEHAGERRARTSALPGGARSAPVRTPEPSPASPSKRSRTSSTSSAPVPPPRGSPRAVGEPVPGLPAPGQPGGRLPPPHRKGAARLSAIAPRPTSPSARTASGSGTATCFLQPLEVRVHRAARSSRSSSSSRSVSASASSSSWAAARTTSPSSAPGLLAMFPMFACVFECAWGSYVQARDAGHLPRHHRHPGQRRRRHHRRDPLGDDPVAHQRQPTSWSSPLRSDPVAAHGRVAARHPHRPHGRRSPGILFSAISICFASHRPRDEPVQLLLQPRRQPDVLVRRRLLPVRRAADAGRRSPAGSSRSRTS